MEIFIAIIQTVFYLAILVLDIYLIVATIKSYHNTEELKKDVQVCNSKENYTIEIQKKILAELEEIKSRLPKE